MQANLLLKLLFWEQHWKDRIESKDRMNKLAPITPSDILFRQLNYADRDEVSHFQHLFWHVPVALGDEFLSERTPEFMAAYIDRAIATENETNTFSGLALNKGEIVGIHVLRKMELLDSVGAHVANLWVDEKYRGKGIAKELKRRGELWAKSIGAEFLNTNVLPGNKIMLEMNKSQGFKPYKINMRKRLER